MKILIVQVSVGKTQGYAYDTPQAQLLFKSMLCLASKDIVPNMGMTIN